MKKRTATSIICIILLSITALAQTQESDESLIKDSWTKVNLQRTIQLEGDSKSVEVLINIQSNVQRFEFSINSSVHSGKLTIEVYDPKGTKRGNFTIGTQLNSELEETANGDIRKSLFEPHSGDWKVKIIPTKASGTIRIRTTVREY